MCSGTSRNKVMTHFFLSVASSSRLWYNSDNSKDSKRKQKYLICYYNLRFPKQLNYCSIPGIFSSGLPEKQAVILFWQQQGQREKESIWWRSLDCHSIVCQTPGHWLLFMMCWKPQIVEVSVSYALQLIGVICRSQWTYSWTLMITCRCILQSFYLFRQTIVYQQTDQSTNKCLRHSLQGYNGTFAQWHV